MIPSLVLFLHITGVLTMFAGLALETFGVEPTGKAAPRIFGLAVPLTLLTGLYMGARFGVLGNAWMCASYGAIAVMALAGPLTHRSNALRQLSLRVRATFGLAIVFLMVAKPDALVSSVVLGLALGVSILGGLPMGLKQPSGLLQPKREVVSSGSAAFVASNRAARHNEARRSRRAFAMTDTELNVIAALAVIGLSQY